MFDSDDRQTVVVFSELARGLYEQKEQELQKRHVERQQIVRDLHDEVGARLLDMVYSAPEGSETRDTAEQAMFALKNSFLTIEQNEDIDLQPNCEAIWEKQHKRLETAGFKVEAVTDFKSSRVISARDFVNISRICEEHISNILKYAEPSKTVSVKIVLHGNGDFETTIINDVRSSSEEQSTRGRGEANMRTRARESLAKLTLDVGKPHSQNFRFHFVLPFREES